MSKRVMVDMSATIIHHGHIRLLKKASEYGEVIVGLTTDEEILSCKGYLPELVFEHRKEVLEAIKYVSEVVEVPWLLTDETLRKYDIDLLVHGEDNSNEIKKEKLLVFPRTKGVASSDIRKRSYEIYLDKENNIYDKWNEKKKTLQELKAPFFKEREIVYLKMGKNIGFEQDGKGEDFIRPVLVYKKFNKDQFIGIALTSKEKTGKFYIPIHHNNRVSYLILSQVRVYSSKRISHTIATITQKRFKEISEKFIGVVTPSTS